jgi:hypothetical protein
MTWPFTSAGLKMRRLAAPLASLPPVSASGDQGCVAWQVPHPVPEPTGRTTPKSAPKGLSARMAEWQVRQPAPRWSPFRNGEPSPPGWLDTVSTWESAWQRRQLAELVMSTGVLAFSLV